jgi:twitching motility protein PilT
MDRAQVDALIKAMLRTGERISDLLFITGKAALLEIDGRLIPFPIDAANSPVTPQFIDALAEHVIGKDERLLSNYADTGSCDCSYAVEDVARFRVNIYKENNRRAMVMRKLDATIPSLGSLGLPTVFQGIVKEKNGIVLVTGATGSGKTTTLAALINELNQTQPIHIVTLEDPIEFLHPQGLAAISHRELGRDFYSFAQGLRAALRQAPKVILVGEIRDRETMEIALTAAETGHLVFSTLHTINAGQTINRILGFFTKDEEEQLRYRLSETIRYIVSQRLVPKNNGGRLLISEVLGSSLRTRESIRYGESEGKTFHEIIDAATIYGWHSFDHCLLRAYQTDEIDEETALIYCNDKGRMRRDLDSLNKRLGRASTKLDAGLKMEPDGLPLVQETELKLKATPVEPKTSVPDLAATKVPEPSAPAPTSQPSYRRVIQPRVTKQIGNVV